MCNCIFCSFVYWVICLTDLWKFSFILDTSPLLVIWVVGTHFVAFPPLNHISKFIPHRGIKSLLIFKWLHSIPRYWWIIYPTKFWMSTPARCFSKARGPGWGGPSAQRAHAPYQVMKPEAVSKCSVATLQTVLQGHLLHRPHVWIHLENVFFEVAFLGHLGIRTFDKCSPLELSHKRWK